MYIRFVLCLLLLLSCVTISSAREVSERNWLFREHLLGDFGKVRPFLEHHGITLDIVYTGEVFGNTRGGINTSDSDEYRGDVSLFVELDTQKAGWWKNGSFFLHFQEQHGHGITNEHVGDFQILSNIDEDDFNQISEFWYKHTFLEDRLWIKLGKMEANADFAFVDNGIEFINSSAGSSPTIPLATYPNQDWGVVVGVNPYDWFYLNVGLYQGDPDGGRSIGNTLDTLRGPMIIAEPNFLYRIGDYSGRLGIGAWWNGIEVEEFDDPGSSQEPYGLYVTWDQDFWKERPENPLDRQGIGLFGQYGYTSGEFSEVEQYIGGGFTWRGTIPARNNDILGLGIFHVVFSNDADFEDDGETSIELFYKAQVTPWLSIKPDVQYIINPGGDGKDDAFAMGIRWEIVF